MNLRELALQQEPYMIQMRRHFHQHPELSWEETETTRTLIRELNALGIETRTFDGHTGVIGTLHGTKPSATAGTVVLRADIDALPIREKTGLPFASEQPGVMHACGHDGHTAMLLGAARVLRAVRDQFAGEVRLLFQPAEETNSGAIYCLTQGVVDGADAIFGVHLWGDFEAPGINIEEGSRMASCDNFTLTVRGVPAHGGAPHQGVDAIVAASAIVLQAQTLVSRNTDPLCPLVLTIGEIHGGKRFNIIADEVTLVGTVRAHDPVVRAAVKGQLQRIAEHTAAAYGATATLDYRLLADPVINPPALTRLARDAATRLFGADALCAQPPRMSSEDFAYYLTRVPGVFCFLGGGNAALGYTAANHNDGFTVDESVLARGAALYAQFAVDFLDTMSEPGAPACV